MLFVLYGMFRDLANRLRNTAGNMDGLVIGGYTFLVDDRTVIDNESFLRRGARGLPGQGWARRDGGARGELGGRDDGTTDHSTAGAKREAGSGRRAWWFTPCLAEASRAGGPCRAETSGAGGSPRSDAPASPAKSLQPNTPTMPTPNSASLKSEISNLISPEPPATANPSDRSYSSHPPQHPTHNTHHAEPLHRACQSSAANPLDPPNIEMSLCAI
jgi:hypothetical protein